MALRCRPGFFMVSLHLSQESWSESSMLSLREAIESGRLQEFIAQEEARGGGPISEAEFDETASAVIRTPQSDDQTSSLPRRDGSRGK